MLQIYIISNIDLRNVYSFSSNYYPVCEYVISADLPAILVRVMLAETMDFLRLNKDPRSIGGMFQPDKVQTNIA